MINQNNDRPIDDTMGPPPGGSTISNKAIIVQQPVSGSAKVGATHTFSVSVARTSPSSVFQWQVRDWKTGTSWQNTSVTSAQYSISPVSLIHATLEWQVIVSIPGVANSAVTSNAVRLQVTQ